MMNILQAQQQQQQQQQTTQQPKGFVPFSGMSIPWLWSSSLVEHFKIQIIFSVVRR
jgi:hypothetical protein